MVTTRVGELAGLPPGVKRFLSYAMYGWGDAAPADGEGRGQAERGAMYFDQTNARIYRNAGPKTAPNWQQGLNYDIEEERWVLNVVRPSATDPSYAYGLDITLDELFTHTGAKKSRGVRITGDRTTAVMGGDAHDILLMIDYTNEAVNTPAGSYARGINCAVNNSDSGAISAINSGFFSTKQKDDGGALTDQRTLQVDLQAEATSTGATGIAEGLLILMNYQADGPSRGDAAGVFGLRLDCMTDGSYTNPPIGIALRNRGITNNVGWYVGLDFYDSRYASCQLAEIRMMTVDSGGLPCIIASGTATDDAGIRGDVGADNTIADGSIYLSVVATGGKIFCKQNSVWVDVQV